MSDSKAVLSIGLDPGVVDFGPYPGQDASTLAERIKAGEAAVREAGFDVVTCLVTLDADDAEARVRDCAAKGPFRAVMIGAGVRMSGEHTPLFERVVNVVHETLPDARFCFNTSPDSTVDAFRRWVD